MKIEHVAMYVNDLEAARDFFLKYLDGTSNDGSFTGKKIPGMGVFAQKVSETSIKMIDVEDLD